MNQSDEIMNTTANGEDGGFESLYEVPTFVVVILSIFYGIISLTAFVGNSLVIYVVVISRRMRTVTNMYIANLAFADVTIAVFAIPFQFHAALLQRWDLPAFMCQFCPTVQILSVNISIFTLVAISLDRYRAIMYPLRRKPSKLFSKVVILLIWILGTLFALPMGVVHTFGYVDDLVVAESGEAVKKPFCYIDFGPNATQTNLTLFQYYSTSLLTVQYFLPMAIISVAYARIAFRLWGTKTPGAAQDERDHNILVNKKKVIKMLLIVVCIFSICWLPWQVYMTTMHVYPEINEYKYINIIFFCCHWLAMSNSCYNPFIYGVYSEKFRREFAVRLPCLRCLKDGNQQTANNAGNGRGRPQTGVVTNRSQSAMNNSALLVNGHPTVTQHQREQRRCLETTEMIKIEVHTRAEMFPVTTSEDPEQNKDTIKSNGGKGDDIPLGATETEQKILALEQPILSTEIEKVDNVENQKSKRLSLKLVKSPTPSQTSAFFKTNKTTTDEHEDSARLLKATNSNGLYTRSSSESSVNGSPEACQKLKRTPSYS